MLKEAALVRNLVKWFKSHDYVVRQNVVEDATARDFDINTAEESPPHGTDLVADSGSKRWIIEAKGDYSGSADYYVDLFTGVGQIASRMNHRPVQVRFGFAVPYSRIESGEKPNAKATLLKLKGSDMWKRLELWLILVRDDGSLDDESVLFKDPQEVCEFLSSL